MPDMEGTCGYIPLAVWPSFLSSRGDGNHEGWGRKKGKGCALSPRETVSFFLLPDGEGGGGRGGGEGGGVKIYSTPLLEIRSSFSGQRKRRRFEPTGRRIRVVVLVVLVMETKFPLAADLSNRVCSCFMCCVFMYRLRQKKNASHLVKEKSPFYYYYYCIIIFIRWWFRRASGWRKKEEDKWRPNQYR